MSEKISEFLAQNLHWSETVKTARQRGYLSCFVGSDQMKFIPILPIEPGNDIDEDEVRDVIEKDLWMRFDKIDDLNFFSEILSQLQELRAGKNALILLVEEEPPEEASEADEGRLWIHHQVVPLAA
jgi:hypothetical protein